MTPPPNAPAEAARLEHFVPTDPFDPYSVEAMTPEQERFYLASQWAQGMSLWQTTLRLPALMALGIGISVTNTRAVVEAVLGRNSPFLRTPKYNDRTTSAADPLLRRRRLPAGTAELTLGILMAVCFAAAIFRPHTLIGAPFLLLFAVGYLGIGLPRLRRSWERRTT